MTLLAKARANPAEAALIFLFKRTVTPVTPITALLSKLNLVEEEPKQISHMPKTSHASTSGRKPDGYPAIYRPHPKVRVD